MTITFTALIVWLIIAAIVGIVGELIAGRRAPDGIIGAIVVIMVMHRATTTGAAPMSGIPRRRFRLF